MQTGTISFCGKTALNIKSDAVKKHILDTLKSKYDQRIVKKHYEPFDTVTSVAKLSNNPYIACLKSNGNPYFMYLIRYNHTNMCLFIDKKILQGYFMPRIIVVRLRLDESLFNGTLLEGEMVKTKNSQWLFLINDMIAYKGSYMLNTNIITRLNTVYGMLENEYDSRDNRFFNFSVKKYVGCNNIRFLCESFASSLPYTNRGVIFKPMFMRYKDILHNFDDALIKQNVRVKYSEANKFITTESVTPKKFKIRTTNDPDVYELLDPITKQVVGQPLVNTLSVSKYLNQLFEGTRVNEMVDVQCRFNEKFKKWYPDISTYE
jgi:hypothetical protein